MGNLELSNNSRDLGSNLADRDPRNRHQAREQLVEMGQAALPVLLNKLSARDWHVRWEACKALGEIGDKSAAEPLVKMLLDDDTSVRWAAMGSLITLGRPAIQPLMLAITRDFNSSRLRQGAHHILHSLYNQGKLTRVEADVFRALEGPTTGIQAAGLANQALISEYIEVKR